MILFLYGTDTFRSRQQAKKMATKFRTDRDPQGLNVVVIDAEQEKNGGRILEEILASPFLAERRMIVLQNLLISKHTDLQKTLLQKIEEQTIPSSTILLFWEAGTAPKTKLAKNFFSRLAQEKYAQEYAILKGSELGGWILAEVAERKGMISPGAVQYLTDNAGHDMWYLSTLLDELLSYTTTRTSPTITEADTELFLEKKIDTNIFTLIDRIVQGDSHHVYEQITEQYRQGNDVSYLFAMMLRQYRILLELHDLWVRDQTVPSDTLAKKLQIHPFVIKKSLPIIRRYTPERLKNTYSKLLQLDKDIKSGNGDPKILFDIFIGHALLPQ